MTGKEVVNLIEKLREEGMSDTKIIEIILYILKSMNRKKIETISGNEV